MCGIYGVVSKDSVLQSSESIAKLSTLLKHRGPDDSGELTDGNLILGMHRLSIVGIDNGHQPIWNSQKTSAIVANGEIYNYAELKTKLEKLGYTFPPLLMLNVCCICIPNSASTFLMKFEGCLHLRSSIKLMTN